MKANVAVALFVALAGASAASAQWIDVKVPGTPRTADGKPDLNAPTPRTADGKPDLTGIWTTIDNHWLVNLAADGVEVPFRPAALALYQERQENNWRGRPSERCLPHGVTDFDTLPFPTKFIQTPAVTVILFEAYNTFRQIQTDGRALPLDPQPSWLGYSVVHWEDDTLVAETIGLNDKTFHRDLDFERSVRWTPDALRHPGGFRPSDAEARKAGAGCQAVSARGGRPCCYPLFVASSGPLPTADRGDHQACQVRSKRQGATSGARCHNPQDGLGCPRRESSQQCRRCQRNQVCPRAAAGGGAFRSG